MARPMPPPPDPTPAPAATAADPHPDGTPPPTSRSTEPHSSEAGRGAAKRRKARARDATSIAREDLNETRAGCRLCTAKQRNPFRRVRGKSDGA